MFLPVDLTLEYRIDLVTLELHFCVKVIVLTRIFTGVFQALPMIVLDVFGGVDKPRALWMPV